MLTAAAFDGDPSSVVAIGSLHMLTWPKKEAAGEQLLSRCTDFLLPIEVTRTMGVIPLFGDHRRMQHVIDGDVSVNWTEAKRKLPAAPVFLVSIQDVGDRYTFGYVKQFPEISRGMGEALTCGIHEAGLMLH